MSSSIPTALPDRFYCSISHQVMEDPVHPLGCHPSHVFEHNSILRQRQQEIMICPLRDGNRFTESQLERVDALRNEIIQWRSNYPNLFEEEVNEEEFSAQFSEQNQIMEAQRQSMIENGRRRMREAENQEHIRNHQITIQRRAAIEERIALLSSFSRRVCSKLCDLFTSIIELTCRFLGDMASKTADILDKFFGSVCSLIK